MFVCRPTRITSTGNVCVHPVVCSKYCYIEAYHSRPLGCGCRLLKLEVHLYGWVNMVYNFNRKSYKQQREVPTDSCWLKLLSSCFLIPTLSHYDVS